MTVTELTPRLAYRYTPPKRLDSLSIVIPARDRAEVIVRLVEDVLTVAPTVADHYEVVVVDDGSTDATAAIVKQMAIRVDAVRLIRNEHPVGYGPALQRAWSAARGEWLLVVDGDGQFDPAAVIDFVPRTDRADIIIGRRKNRRDPLLRRVSARAFNLATRMVFRTGVKDVNCGFKLMRTAALRRLDLSDTSVMMNTELVCVARQRGLVVDEVPILSHPRQLGAASTPRLKEIPHAVNEFINLRMRFNRPSPARLRLHSWLVGLL